MNLAKTHAWDSTWRGRRQGAVKRLSDIQNSLWGDGGDVLGKSFRTVNWPPETWPANGTRLLLPGRLVYRNS
jgi:hypothetical protein